MPPVPGFRGDLPGRVRLPRRPTPYSWPSINSQFGIVDTCGFPRITSSITKLGGARNRCCIFPPLELGRQRGEEISVWVHSNLESVSCCATARASARRRSSRSIIWSGRLSMLRATSRPVAIRLQSCARREERNHRIASEDSPYADRAELAADGEDVAIVRVETVDSHGRFVPPRITKSVSKSQAKAR